MPEDFNKLRLVSKQLVATEFQKEWLFRLDIDGAPSDLDFYVKDVSYNPGELNTDEEQIGGMTFSWPVNRAAIKVNATMRDNEDGRVHNFMKTWFGTVVKSDGTVGLPYGSSGYLKKTRVYWQKENGSETIIGEWEMYPVSLGERSQSRENCAFMEFQISLVQFATE